jgi:ADP-heptose:LPS heptosyltransferase
MINLLKLIRSFYWNLKGIFSAIKFHLLNFRKYRVLIVRPDSLGDYILCRNYFELLPKILINQKQEIVFDLLVSSTTVPLVELLDPKFFNNYLIIDRKVNRLWNFKPLYISKLVSIWRWRSYDLILYPCFTREPVIDYIVGHLKGKKKIAFNSQRYLFSNEQIEPANKFYTQLIDSSNETIFEFWRNGDFFYHLNPTFKLPKKPFIQWQTFEKKYDLSFFLGAQDDKRKWPSIYILQLIKLLLTLNQNLKICLLGSDSEIQDASMIETSFPSSLQLFNLVGKTSLKSLIDEIQCSKLLVTNDTAAFHIASSLGVNNICVSMGYHYGRFSPYPVETGINSKTIYPFDQPSDLIKRSELMKKFAIKSNYTAHEIMPEVVYKAVAEFL